MTFSDQGTYDPRAESGGMSAELARLEAQAGISWEAELAILARLVDTGTPRVLEVGCAGGAITSRLLRHWPGASLTALEPDALLLEQARRTVQAAGQGANVEWVWGSIHDNTLPDDRFDLILVRYVFQHLDDPVASAAALLPKLSARGRLVAIDVDAAMWGAAEPQSPALANLHVRAALDGAGRRGDRLIGRKLWRILQQAGYRDCRQEAYVYHSGDQGMALFEPQLNPARWLPSVACGVLPWTDYLALLEAHQRFMADPDAYVMLLGFAAHGRRCV
jgi:ubiquinone/menaquinone biosynthesis C-methylase UbiE